jgi:signal transduction histidine kinase
VHFNRAILISSALITALLTMGGTYMIVRYVIVKPVKHLKDVSDAITEGRLNVRSEIHSGDEFEDLSLAFNTMLRNLTAARENLERSNGDLDSKVEELALANLSLYESNKLKDDFLATMSHELRTPLNSILGFSDVLMQSEGLTEKQLRWAGNIRTSGQKLLDQVRDILDLAKMESGKMEVRPTEFGLDEACDSALSMFRPLAERQQVDLRGAWSENLTKLRQDMPKFQRILQNLLSNAIKFTPAGGVVCLLAEIHGDNLEVVVEDTGIGVAESEKELVFEKFRQAGNPLTREASGTGLGLSIVRELCLLLGGEIFLESDLGKGSRFTVVLPARLNPTAKPEPANDDQKQGSIIHRPRFSPPGMRPA